MRSVVGGFAGVIDTWDAINEAVIMPVFANGDNAITAARPGLGPHAMVRMAFDEAAGTQPRAPRLCSTTSTCPSNT